MIFIEFSRYLPPTVLLGVLVPLLHQDALRLFHKVGTIEPATIKDRKIKADRDVPLKPSFHEPCAKAGLYAWVVCEAGKSPFILYLGKTGRDLKRRHQDHFTGFSKSARGMSHAERLTEARSRGAVIEIHAYYPKTVFFDEIGDVNIVSSIEDHLLKELHPRPDGNK